MNDDDAVENSDILEFQRTLTRIFFFFFSFKATEMRYLLSFRTDFVFDLAKNFLAFRRECTRWIRSRIAYISLFEVGR